MTPAAGPYVFGLAPALLAALLFARACVFKLRDPIRFEGVVANYRLVPREVAPLVARLLPLAEIALAIGLVMPWTRKVADLGSAALLLLFAAAISLNILRGRRQIDCGCGDPDHRQPLSWALAARNAILALLLVLAAVAPSAAASPAGLAVGLVAALAGFLLILCHEVFQSLPARNVAVARRSRLVLSPGDRS